MSGSKVTAIILKKMVSTPNELVKNLLTLTLTGYPEIYLFRHKDTMDLQELKTIFKKTAIPKTWKKQNSMNSVEFNFFWTFRQICKFFHQIWILERTN